MKSIRRLLYTLAILALISLPDTNQPVTQSATLLAASNHSVAASVTIQDQGSLITNGSFETASVNPGGSFIRLDGGNTSISGWTVLPSNIHYVGTYWAASDGSRSLDLDGDAGFAGGIQQLFHTIPGAQYVVSFDLAGNPERGPTVKHLRVLADGQSADFNFDITGKSGGNMGWQRHTWTFAADDTSATLQFISLDGSGWGPALDNVRVTGPAVPGICVTPPPGLVAWWPGDGNTNDIQGTNHGTLQNGATFAPGLVGQAFSFNGAGDFVSLPASSVYPSGNSPRTVDMWVYTRDLSSWASEHTIFEYGAEPGTRTAFGIDMDGYQMIQFYAWGDDLDHISTGPKPVTGWMHIAVTYDGLTLRVYTDGVLRGTRTYPNGLNTTPSDDIVIGRSNNLFSCCPSSFPNTSFIGLIDEVEVFNRALSESEIQSIYNAGSAGKCKSASTVADLAITKIASSDPISTGTNISYTITIANNGPNAATDVLVTDNLPATTTFISCAATGGGVCGGSGNNRTVTFASLASGVSATITLVANVNCSLANGTAISNLASVSSATPDSNPNNNSATVNVTASNPPPTINGLAASPSVLGPANHQMIDVTINYDVSDNCGSPSCMLSVSSNEPIMGTGDGDLAPDWEVVDAHHVRLRAERAVNGNGRIYTITVTCRDSAGNASDKSVTVTVTNTCGIVIYPAPLAQPYIGIPYAQTLVATPTGAYTFSLAGGALPPGVQLVNEYGFYYLKGTPTTLGTYNFTIKAKQNNSPCENLRSYTLTIAPTVVPILECVQRNTNGSYTAKFGYDNTTGAVLTIPVGANNFITPGAQNRGQTTVFQPGRVRNAFSITFTVSTTDTLPIWLLKGPDGLLRAINVTTAKLGCP